MNQHFVIEIETPIIHDGDLPKGFPGLKDGIWTVRINSSNGQILDWPQTGIPQEIFLQVKDRATYRLFHDANADELQQGRLSGKLTAILTNSMVPNCIPNQYNDYLDFDIDGAGVITNWDSDQEESDFVSSFGNLLSEDCECYAGQVCFVCEILSATHTKFYCYVKDEEYCLHADSAEHAALKSYVAFLEDENQPFDGDILVNLDGGNPTVNFEICYLMRTGKYQ